MITILLEKIKALLSELKTNIENLPVGKSDYSSVEHIIGKWIDGVTDVYEITLTSNTDVYSSYKVIDFNEQNIPDFSKTNILDIAYCMNLTDRNGHVYKANDYNTSVKYQNKSPIGFSARQSLVSAGDISTDGFFTVLTIRYIKITEV